MIETRFVPTNNAKIAVHQIGSGPRAVLVHGFPLDHRMWMDTLHSSLAAKRTLCAVDLRGHGSSPWVGESAHSMESFADDLAAVARTLGDEPIDLVGLSMGGYVALVVAERHPELLRSVALVDTRAGADSPEGRAARMAAINTVVTKGRRQLAEDLLKKLIAKASTPMVRARIQTMIEATPVETIIADQQGMLARRNRRSTLARIEVPALVVVGSLDQLSPPSESEVMAKEIPDSELHVVEGSGHMVPMERPEEFHELLGRFWAR